MGKRAVKYSVYIATRKHGELGLSKIHGPYVHKKDAEYAASVERTARAGVAEVSVKEGSKDWISLES